MIGFLRNIRDRARGAGEHAITVPPMDGTLRPNNDLELADVLLETVDPGNLRLAGDNLFLTSGPNVLHLSPGGSPQTIRTCTSDISAMAIGPDHAPSMAMADGTFHLPVGFRTDALPEPARRCITSMCYDDAGDCLIAVGSIDNTVKDWAKDLLERRSSGSVWRLSRDGKTTCLAKELAWPAGLLAQRNSFLVSEASAARVVRIGSDGDIKPVLSNLPGYPAGLCHAADGGVNLCIMAPRNQLIEFILREREFVHDMIATTDRKHWIAPSLDPPVSFLEPLQGGALKQLGIMKPWAPSRSIGLVVHLNEEFVPTRSHHSRADGRNHGTTSCAEWNGHLVVATRGNNRLLLLPLQGEHQ